MAIGARCPVSRVCRLRNPIRRHFHLLLPLHPLLAQFTELSAALTAIQRQNFQLQFLDSVHVTTPGRPGRAGGGERREGGRGSLITQAQSSMSSRVDERWAERWSGHPERCLNQFPLAGPHHRHRFRNDPFRQLRDSVPIFSFFSLLPPSALPSLPSLPAIVDSKPVAFIPLRFDPFKCDLPRRIHRRAPEK